MAPRSQRSVAVFLIALLPSICLSQQAQLRLPGGREISALTVSHVTAGLEGPTLARLRRIIDSARPVALGTGAAPAPEVGFLPWCAGDFVTPAGRYGFVLFLGGRGDLVLPGGARVRVAFDPSLGPPGR